MKQLVNLATMLFLSLLCISPGVIAFITDIRQKKYNKEVKNFRLLFYALIVCYLISSLNVIYSIYVKQAILCVKNSGGLLNPSLYLFSNYTFSVLTISIISAILILKKTLKVNVNNKKLNKLILLVLICSVLPIILVITNINIIPDIQMVKSYRLGTYFIPINLLYIINPVIGTVLFTIFIVMQIYLSMYLKINKFLWFLSVNLFGFGLIISCLTIWDIIFIKRFIVP